MDAEHLAAELLDAAQQPPQLRVVADLDGDVGAAVARRDLAPAQALREVRRPHVDSVARHSLPSARRAPASRQVATVPDAAASVNAGAAFHPGESRGAGES
jgi:hypothetical protein